MAVAWRSETEGPLCESVDGEGGELGGDIVHGVSARSSEVTSLSGCIGAMPVPDLHRFTFPVPRLFVFLTKGTASSHV